MKQAFRDNYPTADDPEFEMFCEEEQATHTGAATRLVHCYLCEPNPNLRTNLGAGPLRGVLKEGIAYGFNPYTARAHGYDGDPYQALTLSCGHKII